MNLPDTLFSEGWYWLAWAIWLPVMGRMIWRAPWLRLGDPALLNVWLGMIVILTLIWSLKAGVQPGLNLHLMGSMVFTLAFGPELAFVGLNLVLTGITLNGATGWLGFALNALIMAGTGVAISRGIFRFADRFLPNQPFVYIFANGFFGSALAVMGIGLVSSAVLLLTGSYALDSLLENYLPYYLLLGFSEAWLAGMTTTLMVVYFPHWVCTFDDRRYLARNIPGK